MTILCILVFSCSNVSTNSQPNMSDQQAIETLSELITDLYIDSIAITANVSATVYYRHDSINSYLSYYSLLPVYNIQWIDSTNPIYNRKPVSVGNWISDSSYLNKFMNINMYSDSIPFSAKTYDTIPIDTLRIVLQYLTDSTLCEFWDCYNVPLDSIKAISWQHKQDTIIIEMSQPQNHDTGISWAFWLFGGIVKQWSRARWIR